MSCTRIKLTKVGHWWFDFTSQIYVKSQYFPLLSILNLQYIMNIRDILLRDNLLVEKNKVLLKKAKKFMCEYQIVYRIFFIIKLYPEFYFTFIFISFVRFQYWVGSMLSWNTSPKWITYMKGKTLNNDLSLYEEFYLTCGTWMEYFLLLECTRSLLVIHVKVGAGAALTRQSNHPLPPSGAHDLSITSSSVLRVTGVGASVGSRVKMPVIHLGNILLWCNGCTAVHILIGSSVLVWQKLLTDITRKNCFKTYDLMCSAFWCKYLTFSNYSLIITHESQRQQ